MTDFFTVFDETICDFCNRDFTDRPDKGGFVVHGYGVCPICAPRSLKNLEKFGELDFIETVCGADETFCEMVRRYRGGPGYIRVTTTKGSEQ